MDRVRFGRALGFGARQAVKTLVTAVDAATSENPGARKPQSSLASPQRSPPTQNEQPDSRRSSDIAPIRDGRASSVAKTVGHARHLRKGIGHGSKRFGEAVWGPFVRLSGVLWLEVSGVFFGIFALTALAYIWKLRGAWHAASVDEATHRSLLGATFMFVLFGYFCVSSFVRARRRERGR